MSKYTLCVFGSGPLAAAAPPAAQPAEETAANLAEAKEIIEGDTAANPDALKWEGVYCSTATDASDVLGTRGVISVTATATGLPKVHSSYPKEDNEENYYMYDE